MPPAGSIEVVVDRVRDEAQGIRSYDLLAADGGLLPPFDAGAHVDVELGGSLVRSYSLIGRTGDRSRYRIAVMLDPRSRGGSTAMHRTVGPGTRLRISGPRNNFPLQEDAPLSVLIAGGIGITPLWCMAQRLEELGRPWVLHYACRSRAMAAFLPEIEAACAGGSGRLHLWVDEEQGGRPLDLVPIVRGAPEDAQLYCCGPAPMLAAFRDAAPGEWSGRMHMEYFRPAEAAKPTRAFVVELARSGVSVEVPPGCSILDALMMQGIDAPYSCYEGVCGTCETRVISGVPDHRDNLLSDKAKAEGKTILICCSGSRSERLVLDL
ncbi:MAG TPA: PDR/VanB family oxidoreductase [Ramlibacter sp.]|nr:PDR/VanB family oxidoreductase [Ramlibacter sp.]